MTTKKKSKKKPSAAQLRARAKFAKIMKSGGFKNKSKKSSKSKTKKSKSKTKTTRKSRVSISGLTQPDIAFMKKIKKALSDKKTKSIVIRR